MTDKEKKSGEDFPYNPSIGHSLEVHRSLLSILVREARRMYLYWPLF